MKSITLDPINTISGEVQLPGSKSLSNRTLLLAALAEGTTIIDNLLISDDVAHMRDALQIMGIETRDQGESLIVQGCGGDYLAVGGELFLGNSGTSMRSLAGAVTLGHGTFVLDGVPRMHERPIGDLVDGLRQLGAEIEYLNEEGYPPLKVMAQGLPGGTAKVSGAISSQFLTAMLMAAPLAQSDVCLKIADTLVSAPYVDMTIKLMARFGAEVEYQDHREFFIRGQQMYRSPGEVFVEGDASSATYFLAAAAITGGTVTVHGCGSDSLQGDAQFARVLEQMGAEVQYEATTITVTGRTLNGIDIDMNEMPDAAMTLALVGLFANGPTAIRNIYNWRVKETERMTAMVTELRKLGAEVEEGHDYLIVNAPTEWQSASIDTYDDHRIAMAFSLAACGPVSVTINDPDCVSKTFPDYFDVFQSLVK
jgi:3-phosphoshikimate 1-carboxyvinyltransferase